MGPRHRPNQRRVVCGIRRNAAGGPDVRTRVRGDEQPSPRTGLVEALGRRAWQLMVAGCFLMSCRGVGVHTTAGSSSSAESSATAEGPERCDDGWTCDDDDDVCFHRDCVPPGPCDDPGDCTAPQVCVAESCVAPGPCDDAVDCADGEICEQGACELADVVPACPEALALTVEVSLEQPSTELRFRDVDGDSARELDLASGTQIWEIADGTADAVPLLSTGGAVQLLRAVDLDFDGREELVIAQPTMWILNAATSEVWEWSDSSSAPLVDLAIGTVPNDEDSDAWALWECPYLEGCGARVESARFDVPGDGTLQFAGSQAWIEPLLGIATARLDDATHVLVIDTASALTIVGRGSVGQPTVEDIAVRGAGVLATGDLDESGFDEIVRLAPAESQTIASLYESDGLAVSVTLRARFPGELQQLALGDVDGDGRLEAVLAGGERIIVWFDPKQGGCAFEQTAPHDVRALAVGDANGDGRDEIAIGGVAATTVLSVQ